MLGVKGFFFGNTGRKSSKESYMTRSNAREIACHLVFEMNFNNVTAGEALQTLMEES